MYVINPTCIRTSKLLADINIITCLAVCLTTPIVMPLAEYFWLRNLDHAEQIIRTVSWSPKAKQRFLRKNFKKSSECLTILGNLRKTPNNSFKAE